MLVHHADLRGPALHVVAAFIRMAIVILHVAALAGNIFAGVGCYIAFLVVVAHCTVTALIGYAGVIFGIAAATVKWKAYMLACRTHLNRRAVIAVYAGVIIINIE